MSVTYSQIHLTCFASQDFDAGESTNDRKIRERGGEEDIGEDEQRGREVVRLKQRGGRSLNRRERYGTDCALERRLLKYRVVNRYSNEFRFISIQDNLAKKIRPSLV